MNGEDKPWGNYRILLKEEGIQVKRVEVNPGKRLSLQRHFKRTEKWIVIQGRGWATLGTGSREVEPGSFLEIPSGKVHRIENKGQGPLVVIEVQFGDYLGEDDIERLEDDFGRR